MTITVIIIAVVVVLAALLVLLLGMRSLNLGPRRDDYDDHEYDDADEDGAPEDADRAPAPRGRARRRSPESGGRAEGGRPRRGRRDDDWDDDGFWSSLGDDGPDERGGHERDRPADTGPSITAYEYEDDGYDDEETGPPGATTLLPRTGSGQGASADLAVLASLGQTPEPPAPEQGTPEPPRSELPPRPEPRALSAPSARDEDPLTAPWTPPPSSSRDTVSLADRLTSPRPDPLDGPSGPQTPPAAHDPLGAPSSYGSRSDLPASGDPLSPGFRSSSPGSDPASPIWSSMDTGAHQRPQAGYGSPSAGTPADPLTGGYPSSYPEPTPLGHDTGTHRRSSYDAAGPTAPPEYTSGTHARQDYTAPQQPDLGTHSRPSYNTGAYDTGSLGRSEYDTGSFGRGEYDTGSFGRGEYDTGTHRRAPYDSGTRQDFPAPPRPEYDTGSFGRGEYDTGTHRRTPYDAGPTAPPEYTSGTHARQDYTAPQQPDLGTHNRPSYDTGAYDTGSLGRSEYDTGSFGRGEYDTGTHRRAPYDSGTHSRPVPPADNPPLWGEGSTAFGTPGAPTDGGFGGPAPSGQHSSPTGGRDPYGRPDPRSTGYTDPLSGGYPSPYGTGDRTPQDDWQPGDGRGSRDQDPYEQRDRGRGRYEGGYEDGRFI
ncbi:hypothetical protein [Nocardiopsis algeriensis]|uniref:Uncharacterized protein n=1 Tax=Nocardiopsis algeriensis TaxID=1478215 RepID=A0A841ITV3_9ACTN|nr:hypothetical protein [Nocardiopsis algeriensis]MBB6119681.1 hypothetical protein [Nocardiopsis algeriensis]